MTDEELIEKAKNGDEAAETELIERYKDIIVKISRSYFIVGGEMEDLIQEGMIGFYKAVKGFKANKDTSFKTFAIICIKHQIQTAIKKATSDKNKPLSQAVSIQSFSENDAPDILPMALVFETTPAESIINKENFENLKRTIIQSLSKLELKVLKLYLQGYAYKEIAERLNITEKSIDNSLSRIKTKLKERLKLNVMSNN